MTLRLETDADTRRLGRAIGLHAPAGLVLRLQGPLGAGKTSLVQGVAVGLGIPGGDGVRSPSFALVRVHDRGRRPLVHVDLYRLADGDELFDLGLDDWFDGEAVVAVEWPERFDEHLPGEGLRVCLDYDGDGRAAVVEAVGAQRLPRWWGDAVAEAGFDVP